MWFCLKRFPLPLGAWVGLRYFIVALPEPSINYFDSSFFQATLRLWNDLDLSINYSSTLIEFKTKLRNQDQKDKASEILSIG